MAELTPMKKQYKRMKDLHPDCLLFFRLGDFYELFDDDAKTAAAELNLTLTTRDRNKLPHERTPMCGVPYHAAESYIGKLVAKGYKVAICEQTEDPAKAKGLVDRDIIRVVTPGTCIEDTMLDDVQNNFLAAIWSNDAGAGLCFGDVSTGEVFLTAFGTPDWRISAINELSRLAPREILLSPCARDPALLAFIRTRPGWRAEEMAEEWYFPREETGDPLTQFTKGLDAIPKELEEPALRAASGLAAYLRETQKTDLSYMNTVNWYTVSRYMQLDPVAQRNLELTETLRGQEKKGSLLWVLDHTRTAMGGRLLRLWLKRPLLDPVAIHRRLDAVGWLKDRMVERDRLSDTLREISDLERLISRIVYGTAGARDLVALSDGLSHLPDVQSCLPQDKPDLLASLRGALDGLPDLCARIDAAIADEPPVSVREGGIIRTGYDEEIDQLRALLTDTKGVMARLEAEEKERTGIKSLKIGYNKVFGYYIEVSKSYYDQVPETYIRKQTLTNCERYITQDLKEMEHTILSAQERVVALEYQRFCEIRNEAAVHAGEIQSIAGAIAQVDVLNCLAEAAAENNYCMPRVDGSDRLEIREGRHPVVEKMGKEPFFVPNDTKMNQKDHWAAIITGPNMAGKSTYMRQVALIVLMAQMGSFVPARSARIGVVDRIFTRIGASDDLAGGQSTFMVEMTEVAELLKNATNRSLLILDEIGRGTSTYDGMSIARAVLEWCASPRHLGAKTLFATHYHELTALEGKLPGVKNFHISAKKKKDDILFLRKIVPGGADQSYGIEVAGLAGLPGPVIRRARKILEELETAAARAKEAQGEASPGEPEAQEPALPQVTIEDVAEEEVLKTLRETSLNELTPLAALNLLQELKDKLK